MNDKANDVLEQELLDDLAASPELADNQSSDDLYRALANNVWRKGEGSPGVALSWSEAETVVNRVRERAGREPLELVKSGDEGKVAGTIEQALRGRGWTYEPLDTSEHDERHVEREESPPPPDAGERQSPVDDAGAWERQAHEEADRARSGIDPPPATASMGAGGGKRQPDKA